MDILKQQSNANVDNLLMNAEGSIPIISGDHFSQFHNAADQLTRKQLQLYEHADLRNMIVFQTSH